MDPDGTHWRATGLRATTGGRITANAGTDYEKATPWNCFINSPVSNATISYKKRVTNTDKVIDAVIKTEQTPDNLTNIFLTLLEAAETLKSEGGYGMNFGFIRPRGALIEGVGIRHPGVVSYMELWDKMSSMIVKGDNDGYVDGIENHLARELSPYVVDKFEKKQPRKGAMMGVLPIWHPDIEEFIRAKQESGRLTKFNISVLVDDAFMTAVEEDTVYDLHFDGEVYKQVQARDLYDLIMKSTYNRAEPGVLFFDNMNRVNPLIYLGPVTASNPCGEIPGSSFLDKGYTPADYMKKYTESWDDHLIGFTTVCLLGSVNLTRFVKEDRTFDYEAYAETVAGLARLLENVNDTGVVPLPAYEWAVKNIRQYGMGINGLGSVLYMMGLPYGSEAGNEFVEEIYCIKDDVSLRTSALLAKERGPFPMYDERYLDTPYFRDYCQASEETMALARAHGVRNAKRLTNPPLGNSSVICGSVSNGIEPVFSFSYERTIIADEWPEGLTRENVKTILDETTAGDAVVWRGEFDGAVWYYEPHNRGLCFIDEVADYGYSWVRENHPEDLESNADYLVSAQDLPVQTHVSVQALVQANCDQSVSKTANVPADYPFEDFKDLYMSAWKAGLVGFTTYRAGSMEAVLAVKSDATVEEVVPTADSLLELLKTSGRVPEDAQVTETGVVIREVYLPEEFSNGITKKIRADGNKYYLHLSYLPEDDQHPIALWIHSNGLQAGEYVSLNRAVRSVTTLLLEEGVGADLVLDQVEKVRDDLHHVKLGKMIGMALRHCISMQRIIEVLSDLEGDHIASTVTAVRKFLKMHMSDGVEAVGVTCAACGSNNVIYESGCDKCLDCGHSGCS